MSVETYAAWLEDGGSKPLPLADRQVSWYRSIAERAAELLPEVDPARRFSLLASLLECSDDDERFARLEMVCDAYGVDLADAIARADVGADLFDVEPGFTEWDACLLPAPTVPADGYVIGSADLAAWGTSVGLMAGDYRRMSSDELVERANAWMRLTGGEVVPLLGTEYRSFEQVSPPLGNEHMMGNSATGEARKRKSWPTRLKVGTPSPALVDHRAVKVARDATVKAERGHMADGRRVTIQRPHVTRYVGDLALCGWDRTVKQYATRDTVRVGTITHDNGSTSPILKPRTLVGHGTWSKAVGSKRGAGKRTTPVVPVEVATLPALVVAAERSATHGLTIKDRTSYAWTLNGTVIRLNVEPEHNRYRLTITSGNVKSSTTLRKVANVGAAIRNRVH